MGVESGPACVGLLAMAIRWQLGSGLVHFGFHVVLVGASLVAWLPVVSPLPEVPRLRPPARHGRLCPVAIVTIHSWLGDRPSRRAKVFKDRLKLSVAKVGRQALNRPLR